MKHYLRGEEGINYLDLYHLVKFLPSYSFPEGIARDMEDQCVESASNLRRTNSRASRQSAIQQQQSEQQNGGELEAKDSYDSDEKPKFTVTPATARQSAEDLHLAPTASVTGAHSTSSGRGPHVTLELPLPATSKRKPALGLNLLRPGLRTSTSSRTNGSISSRTPTKTSYGFTADEQVVLLPASQPPRYSIFDVFPFSLLVKLLEKSGRGVEGKKAARYRAKSVVTDRNVPLEISMYLVSLVYSIFV